MSHVSAVFSDGALPSVCGEQSIAWVVWTIAMGTLWPIGQLDFLWKLFLCKADLYFSCFTEQEREMIPMTGKGEVTYGLVTYDYPLLLRVWHSFLYML